MGLIQREPLFAMFNERSERGECGVCERPCSRAIELAVYVYTAALYAILIIFRSATEQAAPLICDHRGSSLR